MARMRQATHYIRLSGHMNTEIKLPAMASAAFRGARHLHYVLAIYQPPTMTFSTAAAFIFICRPHQHERITLYDITTGRTLLILWREALIEC